MPLEEKHAVSMINGLLEKKAELSMIFDVLNISLIFHLFLNDLRQTAVLLLAPLINHVYVLNGCNTSDFYMHQVFPFTAERCILPDECSTAHHRTAGKEMAVSFR